MKITEIRTKVLGTKIDFPIHTSFGTMTQRYMILVNIRTNSGLEGWGESWSNFPAWSPYERIHTINAGLSPLLIGEDPLDISQLHTKMRRASRILERQWGAPGPIAQAISALDIALWDIVAKAQNKPLYQLWDAQNTQIPVYASALGPQDPTNLIEKMQAQGISAFKLKLGFGLNTDKRNLEQIRELIGPDAMLMVDANQAWDLQTSLNMISILEPYQINWLEEPLAADEWANMAKLRQELPFKLAAGENIFSSQSFETFLGMGAIDIAQPDVCKIGGLSEMREVCLQAQALNLPFAPHYLGGAVGFLASLHLFAGTKGGLIMELDPHENPLREDFIGDLVQVIDGHLQVPQRPGLGFDANESRIKKYLLDELVCP